MAITRLALANPAANTDTLLHTSLRNSVVSVIATNKSSSVAATVQIWIVPDGAVGASAYAYQAYNTFVPMNNSMETFRFALNTDDQIYVRSSTADVSFSLNGIYETSGNYNKVTIESTSPNAPAIGDVWIDSDTSEIYFYDGSSWVSVATVQLDSPAFIGIPTAPTASVDTETNQIATTQFVINQGYTRASSLDIYELDDISQLFDGIQTRFQPKSNNSVLNILNPLRLILTINGIIQEVNSPDLTWLSPIPRFGYWIDYEGFIQFTEAPPAGSIFSARLMPGSDNYTARQHPFNAVDIILGV